MEIKTIKNYKDLALKFKEITKCDNVDIKILGDNHFHFAMSKMGVSIALICYNNGNITVAPFEDNDSTDIDRCFISPSYFPAFDDFAILMNGLKELVIEKDI